MRIASRPRKRTRRAFINPVEMGGDALMHDEFVYNDFPIDEAVDDGNDIVHIDDEEDEEEKRRKIYTHQELGSRAREREELRDHNHNGPQPRSECFGCVYAGEKNAAAIPYEDIMQIIDMARKSIGRVDLITLARAMAKRYAVLRREINSNLRPGEDPLPPWYASTILEHIRFHNQDPEIQQVVVLAEIQELRDISLNACTEKNENGTIRVNKDQVMAYERLTKLQFFIQSKDPTKMAFYSGGAHVDPKTNKQGLMAVSGKNLVSYWESVRR